MVVKITCCEACEGLTVERVWGSSSGFDDVSFVKLEFYFTGHIFLCGLYKSLYCFAEWCEPFSFVYDLGELVTHIFFHFHGSAVENEFL